MLTKHAHFDCLLLPLNLIKYSQKLLLLRHASTGRRVMLSQTGHVSAGWHCCMMFVAWAAHTRCIDMMHLPQQQQQTPMSNRPAVALPLMLFKLLQYLRRVENSIRALPVLRHNSCFTVGCTQTGMMQTIPVITMSSCIAIWCLQKHRRPWCLWTPVLHKNNE